MGWQEKDRKPTTMRPEARVFAERHMPEALELGRIEHEWETGGVHGGSYHEDSENRRYTSEEGEGDWTAIDAVLEKVAPRLTFLQYKKLLGRTTTDEYTVNEYYGNSTDYMVRRLSVDELYDFLVENELLPEG